MAHDDGDIEELFGGVYRIGIPTPYAIGPVNLYLFKGDDAFDLIDTGPPSNESFSVLEAAIVRLGLGSSRLGNIFLTHGHMDHAGSLAALMGKYGSTAFSGSADIPIIEIDVHETFRSRRESILGQFRGIGFPGKAMKTLASHLTSSYYSTPRVGSITPLAGGEMIRAGNIPLRTIAVPGHSPGSLCFYLEAGKALFSGDTLLGNVTPNPGTILFQEILVSDRIRSNPLGDFLGSLERLADLDAAVAFPGHGPRITDPGGLIGSYRRHHRERLASIRTILDGRSLSCFEISGTLFNGSKSADDLLLQNIEVLAHLIYLVRAGNVAERDSGDGITMYALTGR